MKDRKKKNLIWPGYNRAVKRRKTLYFLLAIELVVLWIVHPSFIPIPTVEKGITFVREMLLKLVWPQKASEFFDKSFRYWIYFICTWLKEQPLFLTVWKFIPYVIPVLILLNYLRCWYKTRSKRSNYPESGASKAYMLSMALPLKKLEQAYPLHRTGDMGIWLTRISGENRSDKVYHWKNGRIDIPRENTNGPERELNFVLENGQAYLLSGDQRTRLVKGEAFPLEYSPDGDKFYHYCVGTWMGGYQ